MSDFICYCLYIIFPFLLYTIAGQNKSSPILYKKSPS
ncbi:hypothetical protein [Staphylococcus phage vB_SauM-V1SA22]|nr:hypothetical protein [Staphylococcus phage vB_SauM-V1SA22]UVT34789.1 hypothetical protein [Staphylococcus phage vB_SauM-V1SA20]